MRLIASDLDGSLLDGDGQISARARAAIGAATDREVEFVAATGRSHRSAAPLFGDIESVRWLLCSNGATLYDAHEGDVVSHTLLRADDAAQIASTTEVLDGLGFAWETPHGRYRDQRMTELMQARFGTDLVRDYTVAPPMTEMLDVLIKVLIFHEDLDNEELLRALGPTIGAGPSISSSGFAFIEITAAEAEKGRALAALCGDLGVAQEDTVAFGDQRNDLGMLKWAHRGYAMANAHPEVLAATPLRAPHHHEDGVAQVVEALLAESQPAAEVS